MSLESVKAYFRQFGMEDRIILLDESSATVELAAHALGCEGKEIAKTMSFLVDDKPVIIVMAGDARIQNHKYKEKFHTKARMLHGEEVEALTGASDRRGLPVWPERGMHRLSGQFPETV